MSTMSPFGAPGRSRKVVGWTAVVVLVAAAVTYMSLRPGRPAAAPAAAESTMAMGPAEMPVTLGAEEQERIGVTFAPVLWGPIDREVRAVAQVNADETAIRTVSPLVEGWVDRLHVDFTGQPVRAGEPLFDLYSPMVVAAEQELLVAKHLTAQVAAGDSGARGGAADLLGAARRRLRLWGVPEEEIARVERTEQVGRTVTFRSPYSGVVIDKGVTEGQRLMPGDVAYRIADLRGVWLEGEVFEQDLPAVRLGLAVRAEFTALPGDVRVGRITYIYPTIDPQTRTARIRVALPNPGLRLKPGMYATIRFSTPGAPSLSVPRSAVLSTGERNLVFVHAGGHFIPRLVTVGSATDDRIEIRSGLERGDTVVASGTFLMDAESNLGTLLGGMGNMPGMDMSAPATSGPAGTTGTKPKTGTGAPPAAPAPAGKPAPDPMPGMDHDHMSMPR